jgi:hypothetical protein
MLTGCTNTHLDALIRAADDEPEVITVTDPSHPLYGRSFALASASATIGRSYIHVPYCGDVFLKISVAATSLHPATLRPPSSKLSIDGIRNLLRLAKLSNQYSEHHPDNDQENESGSGLSGFYDSLRGEP